MEKRKICCHCGNEEGTLQKIGGHYYCPECYYDFVGACTHCGEKYDVSVLKIVHVDHSGGVEYVCPDCMDDVVTCEDCGEYWLEDLCVFDAHGNIICPCCAEKTHVYCHHCGELVYNEEGSYVGEFFYCEACYAFHNIINDYHCGDRPLLWHTTNEDHCNCDCDYQKRARNLFMGVELEIDAGGCDNDNAREILAAANLEPNQDVICEHDSSLNDGFELISSAATLNYHLKNYKWNQIMEKARQLGYVSHDLGTCGLHVHLDRKYFQENMDNPEDLFTILVTNNIEWLKLFSRRREFNYCNFLYAQKFQASDFKPIPFSNGIKKEVNRSLRQAEIALADLRNDYRGHYKALNFNGYNTIEIRFNRGTLRFSTFCAVLQLVQLMADFVKNRRRESIVNVNLRTFKKIAQKRNYVEFLNYIKERGIK